MMKMTLELVFQTMNVEFGEKEESLESFPEDIQYFSQTLLASFDVSLLILVATMNNLILTMVNYGRMKFLPHFSCCLDFHVHCWAVFRHMVFFRWFSISG
jgi:hypothetical protein